MLKAIGSFIFHGIIWLGALACILVWLGLKPKDLWGWPLNPPHWIWLVLSLALFGSGIIASGFSLYRSLKPRVVIKEVVKELPAVVPPTPAPFSEPPRPLTPAELKDKTYDLIGKLAAMLYAFNYSIENTDISRTGVEDVVEDARIINAITKLRDQFREVRDGFIEKGMGAEINAGGPHTGFAQLMQNTNAVVEADDVRMLIRGLREAVRQLEYKYDLHQPAPSGVLTALADSQQNAPSLRSRMITARDELAELLRKHGPKPPFDRRPDEDMRQYLLRKVQACNHYQAAMGADFRLNLADKVKQIRDELQLRSAFSDLSLDNAIAQAESQACTPESIETIREHFWTLAGKMEK